MSHKRKREDEKKKDSFDSIYQELCARKRGDWWTRYAKYAKKRRVRKSELELVISQLKKLGPKYGPLDPLRRIVEKYGSHLGQPFQRIFCAAIKLGNRQGCLDVLCRLFNWTWTGKFMDNVIRLTFNPTECTEEHYTFIEDITMHLHAPFAPDVLFSALQLDEYKLVDDEKKVIAPAQPTGNGRLALAIVLGWKTAQYLPPSTLSHTRVFTIIGHWHANNAWPSPHHHQVAHLLLRLWHERVRVVVDKWWAYVPLLPLLVCTDIQLDDESNQLRPYVEDAVKRVRSNIGRGWYSVLKRIMNPQRASTLVAAKIVSYLPLPRIRSVSELVTDSQTPIVPYDWP